MDESCGPDSFLKFVYLNLDKCFFFKADLEQGIS